MGRYLELAVVGVSSRTVAEKAALHLGRFVRFFEEAHGHDRISTLVRRDVQGWQRSLGGRDLAPSTVNDPLASLSAFTTWVDAQEPGLFPAGEPAKGIKELRLPPLEPRALSEAQVRSLKNVCDRLERFHGLRGGEWKKRDGKTPNHARGRPARDRAIVFVLLSTGLRREDGRLSVRAANLLLERIGRWHDTEATDPFRQISPLRPHDLRRTFAYRLAAETGKDAYELERRLGHGSQRYTNPPEDVAAGYVEEF